MKLRALQCEERKIKLLLFEILETLNDQANYVMIGSETELFQVL